MQKLILIILLFTNFNSYVLAHQGRDGDGGLKIGKCYPAYFSRYTIYRKIDKHSYELRGNWMSPFAILKTKLISSEQMNTLRKMGPINLDLKFMGTKKFPMDNGFDESFDMWEDCTDPTNKKFNSDKNKKELVKKPSDKPKDDKKSSEAQKK